MTDSKWTSRKTRKVLPPPSGKGRKIARWGVLALAVVLLGFLLMREVLYPFRGQSYIGIHHGSKTHYVPKDRNETVPITSFPTRPPGPGERITPDGDLVPKK